METKPLYLYLILKYFDF